MQTPLFAAGIADLLQYAEEGGTATMCAEAVWWRCHRALLADALVVRGVTVCHILSAAPTQPHQLCDSARTEGTTITYIEDNTNYPPGEGT